ncbi:Sensor histidine kinase LiaS [Pontiella sulfatireligans]|uniref:Sensor histidine kinase LiaS n=1 Tax=Pontiella sulfatireligans TaxID=2750658 RepID=A0A6C2UTP5_9BACT|nr:Sensor histidine kinase LiaS [Pontiella sulfatireligans]
MRSAVAGVLLFAGTAAAGPAIESIAEIRSLPPAEAAKGLPVSIEAQVLRVQPSLLGFFAFDGKHGLYVGRYRGNSTPRPLESGDMVRIEGFTSAGEFIPDVSAERVTVLESRPLPEARPLRLDEINSAGIDCDWVSVTGRLTSMLIGGKTFQAIVLQLEMHGLIAMSIQVPYSEEAEKQLAEIMFKQVRFDAVIGSVFNRQRQLTGRVLYVNSVADFKPLHEEEPGAELQSVPIHSLMRLGVDHQQAVRTHGRVTYAGPREIFLRGEQACLKAAVLDGSAVEVGQRVELEGFTVREAVSPGFRARSVSVLEPAESNGGPEPQAVILEAELGPGLNYELVKIQARLVDVGKTFGLLPNELEGRGRLSLLCRSGTHLFEAKLPPGMEVSEQLRPGALLELTGICHLIENRRIQWRLFIDGLWLQLRSEDDLVVLQPVPWWTTKRLLWISGAALGIASLFLVWVAALRKTVGRQTAVIGKQIKRETVLNERQRIARELHDTLEQGLTALSIQLKNILRKIEKNPASAGASVELAESMLRVCREESRASIHDLRGGILEEMDLQAAIEHTLGPLFENSTAVFAVEREGAPLRLTLFAEHHLLRMVTEAANNAIAHAAPKTFRVELRYSPNEFRLVLEDDGCGFDPGIIQGTGRFGVRGMYERANRLHGTLEIESKAGRGTKLHLAVPVAEFIKEEDHE